MLQLNHRELNARLDEVLDGLPPSKASAVCALINDVVTACARVSDRYSANLDDIEFCDDPRQWPEHISNRIRSLVGTGS